MKNAMIKLAAAVALASSIMGCAVNNAPTDVPGKAEAVGTASEAWATSCLSATPDDTFSYTSDYYSTSTYSNPGCYNGQVLLFDDLSYSSEVVINWLGTTPSCPSGNCVNTCESTELWLGAYVWSWNQTTGEYDSPVEYSEFGYAEGPAGGQWCVPPSIVLTSADLPNNTRTVFAVTARPYYAATSTNEYSLITY